MIIGVVFKDGKEIDKGIQVAGKKWVEAYPEQSISIVSDTSEMDERTYNHGNGISFQELQDNGNGWEVVYDSNERVDRTVEYDLPSWFSNPHMPVPMHNHRIDEDGDIETEFVGYYR